MKELLLFFIALPLLSCRKDNTSFIEFTIGETGSVVIQEHNIIIPSDYGGEEAMVNLDGTGGNDLLFQNRTSKFNGQSDTFYMAWVEILDEDFAVAEIHNSGILYQNPEILYDYYGTFPRETHEWIRTCEPWAGAVADTLWATVQDFQDGDAIMSNLNWDNPGGRVSLVAESMIYWKYEFTVGGDSLTGYRYFHDGTCEFPPNEEIFYLVFKKEVKGSYSKYGWVELKITDHNTIHVLRSAIQP